MQQKCVTRSVLFNVSSLWQAKHTNDYSIKPTAYRVLSKHCNINRVVVYTRAELPTEHRNSV